MFWTRPLTVLLIILALIFAVLVCLFGNSLLNTAWGTIALNIISNFYFPVIMIGFVAVLAYVALSKQKRFFGIAQRWPLQMVISTHPDQTTTTRAVFTKAEYDTADELRSTLTQHFPGFLASWAEIFGVNVQVPAILIKGSPLKQVEEWPYPGSLILIGGPTRNKLTEFYLNKGKPWVTFDDTQKKFIVYSDRKQKSREELANSEKLAILERLVIDDKVVIIAFGYGEEGTRMAAQYLASEWTRLVQKYPDKPFAHLLSIANTGQAHLLKEFS
jgi:hypothetical protein